MALSALVIAAIAALPADITVRATVEPAIIPFHYPAEYTVTVEVPVGTAVRMPSMIGAFDGLMATPGDTVEEPLDNGRVRISETYRLDAVFPGNYAIEPATVTIGNEELTLPSPVLTVRDLTEQEVAAAAEFEAALRSLDPAIAAPFWKRWWFWAALAAALGLGVVVGLFLRNRRRQELQPAKTPWEIALARLQALRARELAERGEYDRFYVDLSAILRYYIEARFELHAAERTTPEFLKEMTEAGTFESRHENFLAAFLKQCDYVKFARRESSSDEMLDWFNQVAKFVNETVPRETAKPAEAA